MRAIPILIAALLIAWELFARSGAVTMFMLPPFSAVAERIWANAFDGSLWINIGLTLYRTMAGFLLACAIGVVTKPCITSCVAPG